MNERLQEKKQPPAENQTVKLPVGKYIRLVPSQRALYEIFMRMRGLDEQAARTRAERDSARTELERLRAIEVENARLKYAEKNSAWHAVISACAVVVGSALISSFPMVNDSASVAFGLGWGLVVVAVIAQFSVFGMRWWSRRPD